MKCKYGKLKRPVRTATGSIRRCKKSKKAYLSKNPKIRRATRSSVYRRKRARLKK